MNMSPVAIEFIAEKIAEGVVEVHKHGTKERIYCAALQGLLAHNPACDEKDFKEIHKAAKWFADNYKD